MNRFSLVRCSLLHYGWPALALAAAVAVATAVLTGALFVGDSVQGSLRKMVLEQLGDIDLLLLSDRFFDPGMAAEIRRLNPDLTVRTACILPQITVEAQQSHQRCRGVFVSGWTANETAAANKADKVVGQMAIDEIIINQPLADELNAQVGDRLVIRLPTSNEVPAESPLGRKEGRVQSRAGLTIRKIIPAAGPGKFTLAINQQAPRNAFVAITAIQQTLGVAARVNAIAVGRSDPRQGSVLDTAIAQRLTSQLQPTLADFGISLEEIKASFSVGDESDDQVAWSSYQLTSDRMIWADVARTAVLNALRGEQPRQALTYLANTISKVDNGQGVHDDRSGIPYSTVSALDDAWLALLQTSDGTAVNDLGDDEIVLNSWAAENLAARLGEQIELRYFAPETTHGIAIERFDRFRLAAIVPITEPTEPFSRGRTARFKRAPTRANDRWLTPTVEGITDQDSIDDWDPPFPFDQRRVRRVDDDYWGNYRTTPKAFVTLAAGHRMWGSRFGQVTNIRVEGKQQEGMTECRKDKQSNTYSGVARLAESFGMLRFDSPYRVSGQARESLRLSLLSFVTLWQSGRGSRGSEGNGIPVARLAESLCNFRYQSYPYGRGGEEGEVDWLRSQVTQALRSVKTQLGFEFQPVKLDGLVAAKGTTSFSGLFLGFSLFLIAAALMLVGILVRLSVQMRAREVGLLQAVGWHHKSVARLLITEFSIVALFGSVLGTLAGVLFASVMLWALRSWWVRAITIPFVSLHVQPKSVAVGLCSSLLLSVVIAWVTIRGLKKIPITSLLRGSVIVRSAVRTSLRWASWIGFAIILAAVFMAGLATRQSGMAQAGLFFGSGALVLSGLLVLMRYRLLAEPSAVTHNVDAAMGFTNLSSLALSGLRRQPARSALTAGLVATASFLIIAIAAFRLQPTNSGTGGFTWIARADRPLFLDLNNDRVRTRELSDKIDWQDVVFAPLRVQPGDDASCRNLFKVAQPRILGVTSDFRDACRQHEVSFAWAAIEPANGADHPTDAWDVLSRELDGVHVPVVLDMNTALYSLHLKGRIGEQFSIGDDAPLRFQIVGLLSNTVLQGSLLIAESQFERIFPEIGGYSMMLIDAPINRSGEVKSALEQRFSDEGIDLRLATAELDDLLAIQNTYLSTFQSLGGLGLLLGTVGLAVVQLRNVIERRGEIALMNTMGYASSRIARIVLYETMWLLGLGLVVGMVAASIAIAPHLFRGQATLPLLALTLMLLAIIVCGIASSVLAVRAAQRTPVLSTLRRESI